MSNGLLIAYLIWLGFCLTWLSGGALAKEVGKGAVVGNVEIEMVKRALDAQSFEAQLSARKDWLDASPLEGERLREMIKSARTDSSGKYFCYAADLGSHPSIAPEFWKTASPIQNRGEVEKNFQAGTKLLKYRAFLSESGESGDEQKICEKLKARLAVSETVRCHCSHLEIPSEKLPEAWLLGAFID